MKLLIIDDDAELCALLQEFLQREGFAVDCAHEGHSALAQAQEGGYDLIVLDVMLPGMDGFEILKRLRVSSRVPVLMLTARGEDVDRIVGPGAGGRRLSAEAVQSARTGGARQGHPAAGGARK